VPSTDIKNVADDQDHRSHVPPAPQSRIQIADTGSNPSEAIFESSRHNENSTLVKAGKYI
jgi:hypothetical protein